MYFEPRFTYFVSGGKVYDYRQDFMTDDGAGTVWIELLAINKQHALELAKRYDNNEIDAAALMSQ